MASPADVANLAKEAIRTLHAPESSQQQRQSAHQWCEEFKANFTLSMQVSLSLLDDANKDLQPGQGAVVTHFALHCIEHIVTQGWNAITPRDKDFLKQRSLQLLVTVPSHSPVYIKEKVAAITADIGKRDWPQRWPTLTNDLFSMVSKAGVASGAAELVLLVFRNLGEEVTSFNPHLPQKRRREIQHGLQQCMPQLFSMCYSCLAQGLALHRQAGGGQAGRAVLSVLSAALKALGAVADWAPASIVFGGRGGEANEKQSEEGGLVAGLCSMLSARDGLPVDLTAQVLALLASVASKKTHSLKGRAAHAQVEGIFQACAHTMQGLCERSDGCEDENYIRLWELTMALFGMLFKNHSVLLARAAHAQARQVVVTVLGRQFAHPHVRVSPPALEMWLRLWKASGGSGGSGGKKGNQMEGEFLSKEVKEQLAPELFRVCLAKSRKQATDIDWHAPPQGPDSPTLCFDSKQEYLAHFSKYRGNVALLMGRLASKSPVVCLTLVGQHYEPVLKAGPAQACLGDKGLCTMSSPRYIDLEASGSALENTLRGIPSARFEEDGKAQGVARALVAMLLQYKIRDPLLQTRRMKDLSLFAPLFSLPQHNDTLAACVDEIFAHVTFKAEWEEREAAASLSGDTLGCRKRACHSLIRIARGCKASMLAGFQGMVQRVIGLVQSQQVSGSEQILLYEFLVQLSHALPDPATRLDFVRNVLSEPMSRWTGPPVTLALADTAQFAQATGFGASQDPAARAAQGDFRRQVHHLAHTFAGVFQAALGVRLLRDLAATPENPHKHRPKQQQQQQQNGTDHDNPAQALYGAVLPGVLRMTAGLHALHVPARSGEAVVHPSVQSIQAQSRLHLSRALNIGANQNGDINKDSAQHLLSLRLWLDNSLTTCYNLLSVGMVTKGYYLANDPSVWTQLVCRHAPYLPMDALRTLLDKFATPFLCNLKLDVGANRPREEEEAATRVLLPCLQGLIVTAFARLSAGWAKFESGQLGRGGNGAAADGVDDELEAAEELSLRELGRSVSMLLLKGLGAKDGSLSTQDKHSKQQHQQAKGANGENSNSPPVPDPSQAGHALCVAALGNREVCAPMFALLTGLLVWPDGQARRRACRILFRLLPFVVDRPHFHNALGRDVLRAALRTLALSKAGEVSGELEEVIDYVHLVKAIYLHVGQRSGLPRQVMAAAVPGMPASALDNLEQVLSTPMPDKKHRAAVRALLAQYVIGSQVENHAAAGSTILDLPETLVVSAQRVAGRSGGGGASEPEWFEQTFRLGDLFETSL